MAECGLCVCLLIRSLWEAKEGTRRQEEEEEAVVGPLVGDKRWEQVESLLYGRGEERQGRWLRGVMCCLRLPGTHLSPRGPSSRSEHI